MGAGRGPDVDLSGFAIFAGCTDEERARIAARCDKRHLDQGATVTREGAVAGAFYVIAEGKVSVACGGEHLADLGPGDFFGEMALLGRDPRSATVTAVAPLDLLVINAGAFSALVAEMPALATALSEAAAARERP